MEQRKVLDTSIIKDLSNHIYEKRKATAFQIESLTKSALERNDSEEIYKIVSELGELTNGSTNSARMGAITALGSVSVALGPFAIAYYLDDIITPIFSTFKDTDPRVRYYACESLYNIAKVARGEILLYFNEVFDVLCTLVTDSESSVKNAADILDRLIKDIVSAKATNYVSILHQQNDLKTGENNVIKTHVVDESGTAVQVNQIQDTQRAFSLPKFIPTLLERMYITDPFAKKFLISWLELFDDIPSLELITFLPNFLEPLINFFRNGAPSDVRIETQNILNVFLKEIKSIQKVKYEVRKREITKERTSPSKETELQANDNKKDDEYEKSGEKVKEITLKDEPQNERESIQSEETKESSEQNLASSIVEGKKNILPEVDEIEEEFLEGQNIFIDYDKTIAVLLSFLQPEKTEKHNDLSGDGHEITLEVQVIVLKWLLEVIQITPISFTNFFPDCVNVNIQNLSVADNNKDFELRNQFLKFNLALQSFFIKLSDMARKQEYKSKEATQDDKNILEDLNESNDTFIEVDENLVLGLNKEVYEEFIEFQLSKTLHNIMRQCLTSTNELARVTSLDWLIFLYSREPASFVDVEGDGTTFDLTALLQSATDSSNEVISKVLQLLSKISETNQDFFKDFMVKLILFFEKEVQDINLDSPNSRTRVAGSSTLTRSKVEFIIRKLCVTLDSEKIFKTISEVLTSLEDVNHEFLNMIVVTLNNILLTTPELTKFRKKLKNLDVYKLEDWTLFSTLFQSWSHNSASALSICLLTANYDLAFLIIKSIAESEVTYQLLTQLDILVQLLESPIFLKLRLQLLEPEKNPYLYKTLYGLLMILPQSSTYTTLHNRLSSVSAVNHLNASLLAGGTTSTPISTPGPSNASNSTPVSQQLSIKRKRVYEMLDKYNRIQESHGEHLLNRKLRESAASSLYQTDDISFHRVIGKSSDNSQSKSDRLLSYAQSQSDKKDYFTNIDAIADPKSGKRVGSGRFLHRFNGS
ncbi:ARM repeat-containing protein [Yamadazyma tenuis ATCC 10573]|uniref:ARM repeat-containing protein n=1 Tax=Candida tenuis (strain ATCC 10573 / BCRC 21748 / CBS 615 / JCM 9827 / NBRC 10315 / NRRL Y-1498 / VKM Y-70) TaxID=590646 RepID=G3AXD4_CANTC|nr:ARM repeat-containing protein [Yamadazyma tenuis ATCC 10573]EGV66344.1 ARM repeat-containing protein [Yamadazyma tenuis ATCC 10573]